MRDHTSLRNGTRAAIAACLVAAATSCGSNPVENGQSAIAAVIISPEEMTLQQGRKQRFEAAVLDVNGEQSRGRTVFWAVEDTSIARVTAQGEVEARRVGETKVAASSEGRSDVATLTVIPRRVASVRVSPSSGQVQVGRTLQLQGTVLDEWNDEIAGRSVSWSSSNNARATVSSSGLVTGVSPGQVTITATSEGRSSTASITVVLPPVASITISPASVLMLPTTTRQLTATVRDAQGEPLSGYEVTWSSNRTNVATVTASGLVRAVGFGNATITASAGGRSATATVQVRLFPVASVSVQPDDVTLDRNQQRQLTARLHDENGNQLADRAVSWTTSNPSIATVTSSGLVRTLRRGTVTITARSEGVSGTARVRVRR